MSAGYSSQDQTGKTGTNQGAQGVPPPIKQPQQGHPNINNQIQGQAPSGTTHAEGGESYMDYMERIAPFFAGRQFRSQQNIENRNSFAATDPVMKKFGINIAQDGVAEFIPMVNYESMEHLFAKSMTKPETHQFLLRTSAQIPEELKKEFYGPSHFYEGVPSDLRVREMHLAFTRQRQERFYAFV